jgi:uncharacterized protein YndB with AHSA1/START domain
MSDGLMLEVERVLAATPAVVFSAFADSDRLAGWWGPAGFTVPRLDFQAEVGRPYSIEMQPPEGERFRLTGEFRRVEPPSRLDFTFAWEPADPDDVETLVELSFQEAPGDSTELALSQGRFKTTERLQLHRDGWSESLDRLQRLLGDGP